MQRKDGNPVLLTRNSENFKVFPIDKILHNFSPAPVSRL
jgi:hypothetical protein